jgi:hypothetical protein
VSKPYSIQQNNNQFAFSGVWSATSKIYVKEKADFKMIPEAYYVHTKPYPMTRFSGICAVPLHEKYTLKFPKTLDCLNLWHQLKFTGLRKKPLNQKKLLLVGRCHP